MEVSRRCKICGAEFVGRSFNTKYCSEECRRIAAKEFDRQRDEREKAKRHMSKALKYKANKLDERLQEARENGLTYAELQVQKTLEKTRKGEL